VVDTDIAALAAPYLGRGFVVLPTSFFEQDRLTVSIDRPSCLLALAARGSKGDVVVERPGVAAVSGPGSVAWCTCGPEEDNITSKSGGGSGGVRVLRAEAGDVGGDYGLFFLEPRPSASAPLGRCAGATLDSFIRDGKGKLPEVEQAPLGPLGTKLASNGFVMAATAPSARPFALVAGAKDSCWIGWSADSRDTLTLRTTNGDAPLSAIIGPVGVCTEQDANLTLWRDGKGALYVERVPAGRIGGTHGLREAADRVGVGPLATWVSPSDLAWNAAATLRADRISAPEIEVSTDGRAVGQARVVALSMVGATVTPSAQSGLAFACEPALAQGVTDAFCTQGTGLSWDVAAAGAAGTGAGVAAAALPFWMQTFESAIDPAVLRMELVVAKMGRRLVAEGFEPTILGGLTEQGEGLVVLGRPGDDAIVAADLVREPPWAVACTEPGEAPWGLAEEPRRVPLAAGAKVKLTCPRGPGASRADGHAVVFRHLVAK
jgi:hypothetical protein